MCVQTPSKLSKHVAGGVTRVHPAEVPPPPVDSVRLFVVVCLISTLKVEGITLVNKIASTEITASGERACAAGAGMAAWRV